MTLKKQLGLLLFQSLECFQSIGNAFFRKKKKKKKLKQKKQKYAKKVHYVKRVIVAWPIGQTKSACLKNQSVKASKLNYYQNQPVQKIA